MDPNQQTSIESKLQWAWRQERRFINIRGAFRVLIWFIGLLAIGFIIDWGLFAKAQQLVAPAAVALHRLGCQPPHPPGAHNQHAPLCTGARHAQHSIRRAQQSTAR